VLKPFLPAVPMAGGHSSSFKKYEIPVFEATQIWIYQKNAYFNYVIVCSGKPDFQLSGGFEAGMKWRT
jgi:hypothetical protein